MKYGIVKKVANTNKVFDRVIIEAKDDFDAYVICADYIRYLVCKVDCRIYNLNTKHAFNCRNYAKIGDKGYYGYHGLKE